MPPVGVLGSSLALASFKPCLRYCVLIHLVLETTHPADAAFSLCFLVSTLLGYLIRGKDLVSLMQITKLGMMCCVYYGSFFHSFIHSLGRLLFILKWIVVSYVRLIHEKA